MEKKNPFTKKNIITKKIKVPIIETYRLVKLEETSAFGKEDISIGYKILYTDNKGKQKTKITVTPPTTPS